jgi:hypothetical protein
MTTQEMLNITKDAITASGKPFNDLTKESLTNYFTKQSFPKGSWELLYSDLDIYYNKKTRVETGTVKMDSNGKVTSASTDYYSNQNQNDVKKRTPRKSIFGNISKISE